MDLVMPTENELHERRAAGYAELVRKEIINNTMATVRQGTLHRLENIRLFADREKPNRKEILELVAEIEAHLAKVGRLLES